MGAEMKPVAGTKALFATQKGFRDEWLDELSSISDFIGTILTRSYGDRQIPAQDLPQIQAQVGNIVQRMFVHEDMRSAYHADDVPLATFPRLLNKWYAYDVYHIARHQQNQMLRALGDDNFDLIVWLGSATLQEIYQNPLANYDPMHLFVDPRGYRLSDNIWRTSIEVRMRVDAMMAEGIRNGTSSLELSKRLRAFLLDENKNWFTNKPYGTSAVYPSLRLARTEISAAHGRATIASSKANPFVQNIEWRLSARHPQFDICDLHAESSPYTLDSVPRFPAHPNCLCALVPLVTNSPQLVIQELRGMRSRGERAPFTVLSNGYLRAILGGYLYNYALQMFNNLTK